MSMSIYNTPDKWIDGPLDCLIENTSFKRKNGEIFYTTKMAFFTGFYFLWLHKKFSKHFSIDLNRFWIDDQRKRAESDDHWGLRRAFMYKYEAEFPPDRLLMLSEVFSNVLFLRCTYQPELMVFVDRVRQEMASEISLFKMAESSSSGIKYGFYSRVSNPFRVCF